MRVCKANENMISCPHLGDIDHFTNYISLLYDCAISDVEDCIEGLKSEVEWLKSRKEKLMEELANGCTTESN